MFDCFNMEKVSYYKPILDHTYMYVSALPDKPESKHKTEKMYAGTRCSICLKPKNSAAFNI